MTMRKRFYGLAADALDADERVAMVVAEIGVSQLPKHSRLFNVGIREQLMIGVAAGLALEGLRPVAHSYTPFLVERPYEMVKLDLGHQDLGAVLVSTGASYDASTAGRTHQAPEDVAIMAALPGWTIHVPGHAEELERVFRRSLRGDDRVYIRMSEEENAARVDGEGVVLLRRGSAGMPLVLADGQALKHALQNLFENAHKYGTKGNNWIGIFAAPVSNAQGPAVEIRIVDRGPGIPTEERELIFDSFFRGRHATDDQVHGTGLGLNLAKKIIEAHGGTIRVSSQPNERTEFIVTIPAAPPEKLNELAHSIG